MLLHADFSSFVRTALKSNKIGRVGESAPLEGRRVLRGLSEGGVGDGQPMWNGQTDRQGCTDLGGIFVSTVVR